MDGAILGDLAKTIGRTDDLASSHSTSCQETTGDLWPVVSAPVFIDSWGSSEFAPSDHADVLIETPLVKILNQGGDGLVEFRKLQRQSFKVRVMTIPTSKGKRHAANPGFYQSPCSQELIHPMRTCILAKRWIRTPTTIAIPHFRILLLQIEGFYQPTRSQHVKGLLGHGIGCSIAFCQVNLAAESIETL